VVARERVFVLEIKILIFPPERVSSAQNTFEAMGSNCADGSCRLLLPHASRSRSCRGSAC
jgi:hypothetical protein